jgi:glutathione synthase/RimK-type ligase-like ATP-grasp enzyme
MFLNSDQALRSQESKVFCNNMAMVMGPTPPGTGVIKRDFFETSS